MSSRDTLPDLRVGWCDDVARAGELADFFVEYAPVTYISHGELQSGRAPDRSSWAPDLRERTLRELELALQGRWDEGSARVALASNGRGCLGFAVVALHDAGEARFAIVEDLVVAEGERSRGVGGELLDFIEAELRRAGVPRVFLESGVENHAAHRFFERQGYERCSVSMMKELDS